MVYILSTLILIFVTYNTTISNMVIYKITNIVNGKSYVGKDKNNVDSYYGSGKLIKLAINKYGKENFTKQIIDECDQINDLNKKEIYWIKHYKTLAPNGYNIATGGEGGDTFTHNSNKEIIRLRRSASLKGKAGARFKQSDKAKKLISQNNAKYWLGKHLSDESKAKIRFKNKKQDQSHRFASYRLINPNGDIYIIQNSVIKFLKEFGLSKTQFYRLIRGEILNYKQWKKI